MAWNVSGISFFEFASEMVDNGLNLMQLIANRECHRKNYFIVIEMKYGNDLIESISSHGCRYR